MQHPTWEYDELFKGLVLQLVKPNWDTGSLYWLTSTRALGKRPVWHLHVYWLQLFWESVTFWVWQGISKTNVAYYFSVIPFIISSQWLSISAHSPRWTVTKIKVKWDKTFKKVNKLINRSIVVLASRAPTYSRNSTKNLLSHLCCSCLHGSTLKRLIPKNLHFGKLQ